MFCATESRVKKADYYIDKESMLVYKNNWETLGRSLIVLEWEIGANYTLTYVFVSDIYIYKINHFK